MADKKKKLKKNKDKLFNIEIEEGPRGNPAVVETYEDARENAMINRDVPTMKNGGNTVKPVKAVAGVLAGLAAGVAPGIIGVGMLAKKKMKKKSSTVSPDDVKYSLEDKNMLTDLYQKATKQETSKMNSGGEVEVMRGGDYIKDLID
jgi:hypothetical protein